MRGYLLRAYAVICEHCNTRDTVCGESDYITRPEARRLLEERGWVLMGRRVAGPYLCPRCAKQVDAA